MTYSLHLSAEQLEIRDTVRDFVAQEIKPFAIRSERLEALDRSLPLPLLDQASQLGLRTLALSEELGGAGADNLTACIVAEELAAGDPDIAAVLSETSRLAHLLFDQAMTAEQRERFLPAFLADDRYHLALADEEPGTDPSLGINYHRPAALERPVKTTATRQKGEWIIDGAKDCVANAPVAKLLAVTVKIDPPAGDGIATILVPHDAPGLTVRAHEDAERWFHGACGEVIFANCRVPAENLLGHRAVDDAEPGRGAPLAQAINLGIGRAAYEAALAYAQLRVQGGRRIVEHQAIGAKLAEVAIRLEVARTTIWQAAWASDHPQAQADRSLADLPLTMVAKAFCSEAIYRAAKDAAECFGAMGVMRDMPLHKHVRDALISLHAGGRNSDAKLEIAEALAGYRRIPATSARAAE
jgi:alkylation response protein AidB-like acyl-CoA dehydrogenase